MPRKSPARQHHSYRQGGRPKSDKPAISVPKPARNKSWTPGDKGQGREGFSNGYGGSSGSGKGPSGPERD